MSRSSTVYVADDNPAILQGLDRALSANGYRVQTAHSGPVLLELSPPPPTCRTSSCWT
jgi:CheY-like chemotaxis protein